MRLWSGLASLQARGMRGKQALDRAIEVHKRGSLTSASRNNQFCFMHPATAGSGLV